VAVGGVVIAPGPRVLVVRRGHPPLEGAWTLPGGRPLADESLEAAVAREVFEETGVTVRVGQLIEVVELVAEGYAYAIHDHLCTPEDDAVPRAGDDAEEARYVAPDQLRSLDVAPAAMRVVQKALALFARLPESS
jgi:8-oxo-dGTP diphosphatase